MCEMIIICVWVQVATLSGHVEAQNQVVRKLEEKERILQNSLATAEKELALRQQAMEMHKRKAIESAQSAADLKLHLGEYSFDLFDNLILIEIGTILFHSLLKLPIALTLYIQ